MVPVSRVSRKTLERIQAVAEAIPFFRWMGIRITELRRGQCQVELDVRPEMLQIAGSVHGGILASLIDVASAIAVMAAIGRPADIRTLELKVNYLRPVRSGTICAFSQVIHLGSRTAVTTCHVRMRTPESPEPGKLCAYGVATFMRIESERSQPVQ